MRSGFAHLPLHGGKALPWLFSRMVRLSREVLGHLVAESGAEEVLRRLSDPFWFQAFGCVLGFDWHSSGVTTTVCGAVKESVRGLESDFGFYAAGGKGKVSRKTPSEITAACEALSLDPAGLVYASRMSANPARFSFAHGGEDGHPFPVDRPAYDRTIDVLHSALARAKVGHAERVAALKRLANFPPPPSV